jgi:hypothetical protein
MSIEMPNFVDNYYPPEQRKLWISNVDYQYRQLNERIHRNTNGFLRWVPKDTELIKPLPGEEVIEDGENIILRRKKSERVFHKDEVQTNGVRIIKLGFVNHPAVRAWIGYDSALKHYINCHITAFVERGCNNNMKYHYDVPDTLIVPPWVFSSEIHDNHRAALIQKEIDRNEPDWYKDNLLFVGLPPFVDYIWP